MQHMQDVLLLFFSNNIFGSFCNTGDIKPRFKAIKTSQKKKGITFFVAITLLHCVTLLFFLLFDDLRKTRH